MAKNFLRKEARIGEMVEFCAWIDLTCIAIGRRPLLHVRQKLQRRDNDSCGIIQQFISLLSACLGWRIDRTGKYLP